MAEIKKINTEFQLLDKFLDTSGDAGTSGQVLSSTATGINWVSGSNLPGGPYLPLAGGTMIGDLKLNDNVDLYIGTGNDFQAYHDGSNTYLRNLNGSFVIKQDKVDADLILESDNGSGGTTPYLTLDGSTTHAYFSNPGNVGIGTTSPSAKLNVADGNILVSGGGVRQINVQSSDSEVRFGLKGNNGNQFRFVSDGTHIKLNDTNTERIKITNAGDTVFGGRDSGNNQATWMTLKDQTGNVGIGTTSPSYPLTVKSKTGNVGVAFFDSVDNWERIYIGGTNDYIERKGSEQRITFAAQGSSGLFTFQTSGSEKFRIANNGNVGIGTTSPGYKLQVNGTIAPEGNEVNNLGTSTNRFNQLWAKLIYDINNGRGLTNQVLTSTGSGGIAWANASTVIGGPYLPLAGGTMTGNTSHSDNVKDRYGTGNDFQIWHDGSNTFLSNEGEGHLNIINTGDDRDIIFKTDDGTGATTSYMVVDGSAEQTRFYKDTRHADGIIANFGNSDDLKIYHDGSNSYIEDTGTGDIFIKASNDVFIQGANSEFMAEFSENGSVDLYHNGSKKFETTSTGVSVTGNLVVSNDITATGDLSVRDIAARDATLSGQGFSAATSSGDGSSTLTTKGYVDGLITGATIYRGAWDPSGGGYGSPDLSGVTQTSGYYYICSAAGTAEPNGTGTEPDTWETGDWVIYNDVSGTGQWQKIDNSSVLSGVGTGQTVALWQGASSVTDSETLGNAPITVNGNNATFAGNVTLSGQAAPQLFLTSNTTGTPSYTLIANASSQFIIGRAGVSNDFTLNSGNATFAGSVSAEDNIYLTDAGTVRAKLLLNASDRDNVELRAESLGSTMKFFTVGTEALELDASQNATFAGSIDTTAVNIKVGSATHGTITSSSNSLTLNARNTGTMLFQSGGVEKMRILNNGNVGIGTTSPTEKLVVQDGKVLAGHTNTRGYGFHDLSNYSYTANTGRLSLVTAGVEAVSIDSNQNVGIGTTSPQSNRKLDVAGHIQGSENLYLGLAGTNSSSNSIEIGAGRTGNGFAYMDLTGDATYSDYGLRIIRNNTGANASSQIVHRGTGDFSITTTESADILLIPNSGNVGIGTTSPNGKLTVADGETSGVSKTALEFIPQDTYDRNIIFSYDRAQSAYRDLDIDANDVHFNNGGTERMRITSSGNVGIGTTSPAYKLDVNGTGRINGITFLASGATRSISTHSGAGQLQLNGGTSSANGAHINIAADSYGSGDFVEVHAARTYLSGNVGIGTTSPGSKLEVNGDIDTTGSNGYLINGKGWALEVLDVLTLGDWDGQEFSTRIMDNNSNEVLRVTDGRVGIGTTSPNTPLEVTGGISTTSSDFVIASTGERLLLQTAPSPYSYSKIQATSGGGTMISAALALQPDGGYVGIGTTSPLEKLEVQGTIYATPISYATNQNAYVFKMGANNNTAFDQGIKIKSTSGGVSYMSFNSRNEDTLVLRGANVGIGTADPGKSLELSGGANVACLRLRDTTSNYWDIQNTTFGKLYFSRGGSFKMGIDQNGGLSLVSSTALKGGGGTWGTYSDKRVKKDISIYTKGLDEILAINPVNYKYNGKANIENKKEFVGIIAQEIKEVLPNTVEVTPTKLNDDDEFDTDLLTFDASELTFTLINAVKELKAEIEELKTRIQTLENN